MNRYALVRGGSVENVILWDRDGDAWPIPADAFVVACGEAVGPGWAYAARKFTSEAIPTPPRLEKTEFSVREFRARFTQAEQLAVRAASLEDMAVGLVYDDFNAADYIDVNDPDTAAGIDLYIQKGLLDASRREALLAAEVIQDGEPIPPAVEDALSEEIYPA